MLKLLNFLVDSVLISFAFLNELIMSLFLNIGFTCPSTIYFKFITKCDSLFYYKVRWSVITMRQLFYHKVRQVLLQSAKGITKCDNFISFVFRYWIYLSSDHPFQVYYKVRQVFYKVRQLILLQSAMVCYYKMRQLFYYKVRQNKVSFISEKAEKAGVVKDDISTRNHQGYPNLTHFTDLGKRFRASIW